jgi:hypothetical protein
MKKKYLFTFWFFLSFTNLFSQMTVKEINYKLDTQPYFSLDIDCETKISIPDSIKEKILNVLERKIPQHYIDSVFTCTINKQEIDEMIKIAWKRCEADTICFNREYEIIYHEAIEFIKKNLYTECFSRDFILACGKWMISDAIPYFKNELHNNKCIYQQKYIKAALAKLGNDSIYQQIKKSRTLSYLIENKKFDTISNTAIYGNIENVYEHGISDFLAYYLEDKSFLFDIIDLLYLKGQVPFTGLDYISIEISLLMDFSTYLFRNNPHFDNWDKLCGKYLNIYINAEKNKKEYKRVSSYNYKQKMIEEMKKWIIENVNFE